jgi:two-component system chemotaxis response regulator CheB
MFSTMTEHGARATVEALACGANDYVSKPANVGSVSAGMEQVRELLIPKIFAACPDKAPAQPQSEMVKCVPRPRRNANDARVDVLAIASSTGGPNALSQLLSEFPADIPVPIVIVQHMPAMFTRLLADQIGKKAHITVSEARDGELLRPGHAFVAPGDFHLEIVRKGTSQILTHLNQGPPENSCRPSADVLFRSVASVFGKHTLGVVLTGMGRDGCLGSQAIHETGGHIVVQDQASSVVWGMAGSVVRANIADGIWPLTELGEQILERIKVARPLWNADSLSHV